MYTKIEPRQPMSLTVVMLICFVVLGTCRQSPQPTTTPSPSTQPSPTLAEVPEFLPRVSPKPGALVVGKGGGVRVVWATLRLEEVAEPGETLGLEEMQGRVEFLIDGNHMDVEIEWGSKPGVAEVEIIGDFGLSLGEHEATVQVHRTSGKVLEYSWTFTVLAEEPTLPGLPEGLQFVRPLPDSTITLQAYREEHLVPPYHAPGFATLRGGVCVGILPYKLVRHGEQCYPWGESRYSFVALDGIPPGTDAMIEGLSEGVEGGFTDETGAVMEVTDCVTREYQCWRADLAPGEHEATVWLEQPSGEEIEYTWRFTITTD